MRWTRRQPASTRRMALCDCRTRCALLCRCVRLAGDLNDDAFAVTENVGEAPGEATTKESQARGKQARSRRGQVMRRVRPFAGRGWLRQVRSFTPAESGRAPATTCFLLLPPCFPGFPDQGGEAKNGPE